MIRRLRGLLSRGSSAWSWAATGWPERDFTAAAREYLLAEARQRVQEQLSFMDSQDAVVRTTFTISVLLASAAGLTGDISFGTSPLEVLTIIALAASLITWICSWAGIRLRDVGTGIEISVLARNAPSATHTELQDYALEALILQFELNRSVTAAKAVWSRRALYGLVLQLLLLVATVITSAI